MSEHRTSTERIARNLGELRFALARRALREGVIRGIALSAVGLVIGVGWMAWVEAPWARGAVMALVVACFALPVLVTMARAHRRYGSSEKVGALVEQLDASFRTDVRTALEFMGAEDERAEGSRALRARLVARVAAALDAERGALRMRLPRADQRISFGSWILACVVGAMALVAFPESYGTAAGWLISGQPGTSLVAAITPRSPVVSTVDIIVRHPSYTGRSPTRQLRSTGDIYAMVGSEVELRAMALRPVSSARVVVEAEGERSVYALDVNAERTLTGRIPITRAATYVFEVELPDEGGRLVDPRTRTISIEADIAPRVDLLEPATSRDVDPLEVVDIEFIATDDHGLREITLVWFFAGDEQNQRQVPLQSEVGGRTHREHVPFDLAPLALQPREEVIVFIEARDNDVIGGPNAGVSRSVSLRVAAPEDAHAEVLEAKRVLFEALLRQLGATLVNRLNEVGPVDGQEIGDEGVALEVRPRIDDADAMSERVRASYEAHEEWVEVLATFERLVSLMEDDTFTEPRDLEMLTQARTRLVQAEGEQARRLEGAQAAPGAGTIDEDVYGEIADGDARLVAVTERTILVLEDLIAIHQAADVARTLEELDAIRDRLSELMQAYRDTQDPAVRESIERELRRLESRMRELMERLASQMENLPFEHLNAEALEPSEAARQIDDMASAMDEIRRMMDEGDIEGAMAALERLGESIDAMMQEFGNPLSGASPDGLSAFDEAMGELMDELNAVTEMELEIERQTQELLDELNRARQAEIADEVERRLDAVRRMTRETRQRLERLEQDRLGAESQRELVESIEQLRRLEETLAQDDIAGGEEQSARLISRLNDALWQLRRDEVLQGRDPVGRRQVGDGRQAVTEGEATMRDVNDALRELMQMGQPQPGDAEGEAMRDLAEQQAQVQERLEGLQQRMDEAGERFPFGEEISETLEGARESMEGAGQSLRQGQPRPALRGEQQAIEGLRQARQEMQQMMQQQRQQQRQQQGRNSEDRVEIPGEGDSGRANFRQDVVDAMREGGVESYTEELRRYYDSLLQ